eukprot:GFYU01018722.1.p1 GENE.GFYU01018722.1~~GFYU01018722.1.p1  ORF type:complete len:131 (-),score=17.41 GFYU01018722.1:232-624(-)
MTELFDQIFESKELFEVNSDGSFLPPLDDKVDLDVDKDFAMTGVSLGTSGGSSTGQNGHGAARPSGSSSEGPPTAPTVHTDAQALPTNMTWSDLSATTTEPVASTSESPQTTLNLSLDAPAVCTVWISWL